VSDIETSRTRILAYLIDLTGTLPQRFAEMLVAQRVTSEMLYAYDQARDQWTETWQSLVYTAAYEYFLAKRMVPTTAALQPFLVRRGVVGDSLQAYLVSIDQARAEPFLADSSLHHHIDVLRQYRTFYVWQALALEVNDMMQQSPLAALERMQQGLSALHSHLESAEPVWDLQGRSNERLERHLRFQEMSVRGEVSGHYTGLVTYDGKQRGLLPTEIMCVVGRTSQGKTVVLQHCAVKAMRDGKNVVYVSSEMGWSREHNALMDRFEAMITGWLHSQDLRWGTIDPAQIPLMRQWFNWLSTMQGNIQIVPPQRCNTINEIVAEARALHRKRPIELLVVDYLNEISAGRKEPYLDKRDVTRGLLRLGEELGCPVICAAQTSRYGHSKGTEADAGELMSESEYIAKVVDTVLQIQRAKNDSDRLVFTVKKARHAEANWSFSVKVDWTIPMIGGDWRQELMDYGERDDRRGKLMEQKLKELQR
jgi:KaiC/GvpD/RAD55 family RecA-like ATPase